MPFEWRQTKPPVSDLFALPTPARGALYLSRRVGGRDGQAPLSAPSRTRPAVVLPACLPDMSHGPALNPLPHSCLTPGPEQKEQLQQEAVSGVTRNKAHVSPGKDSWSGEIPSGTTCNLRSQDVSLPATK